MPQHTHTHFMHYKRTCVQRRPADTLHFLCNTFSPTRPSPSEGFALRSGRSLWAGRSTASGRARGACPCALTCLKIASQVHAARCIPITASAPLFLSERPRAPRPRPFHHPSLLFKQSRDQSANMFGLYAQRRRDERKLYACIELLRRTLVCTHENWRKTTAAWCVFRRTQARMR